MGDDNDSDNGWTIYTPADNGDHRKLSANLETTETELNNIVDELNGSLWGVLKGESRLHYISEQPWYKDLLEQCNKSTYTLQMFIIDPRENMFEAKKQYVEFIKQLLDEAKTQFNEANTNKNKENIQKLNVIITKLQDILHIEGYDNPLASNFLPNTVGAFLNHFNIDIPKDLSPDDLNKKFFIEKGKYKINDQKIQTLFKETKDKEQEELKKEKPGYFKTKNDKLRIKRLKGKIKELESFMVLTSGGKRSTRRRRQHRRRTSSKKR